MLSSSKQVRSSSLPDVMVVPYWRSSGESNCYRCCQGVPWAFHDHFVWGIDSQWSFNTSAICTLFDSQMSSYHTGWFLSDPSKSDHRPDVYPSQGPFWNVLVLYGHCPNSFRPPRPLSNGHRGALLSGPIYFISCQNELTNHLGKRPDPP